MAKPTAVISQKDYLQKYLTGKNSDKKKKKRKIPKLAKEKRSIIVDDDDIKTMRELGEGELDLFSMSEDAPQIAGIIDERPEELRTIETFRSSARWKVISDEHGIEDIRVVAVPREQESAENSDADLSPTRNTRNDSDESPPRNRKNRDSDESPPQNRNRDDSDESPPRPKGRNAYDSDESPPRTKSKSLGKQKNGDRRNRDSPERKQYESKKSPPRQKTKPPSDESPWGKRAKRSASPFSKNRKNEAGQSHGSKTLKNDFDNQSARRMNRRQTDSVSDSRRHYDMQSSNSKHMNNERMGVDDLNRQPKSKYPPKFDERTDSRHMSSRTRTGEYEGRSERGSVRSSDGDALQARIKQEPESPPRRAPVDPRARNVGRNDDSDEAPPRRESNPSESPPRKSRKKSKKEDSDESPPRKSKKKADSYESPPRYRKKTAKEDEKSISRKNRHKADHDSEDSPPRKSKKNIEDSDESPPRKTQKSSRGDCDKQTKKHAKKATEDSDESPPRKSKKHSREDLDSQARKRTKNAREDSDESPPRIGRKGGREDREEGSRRVEEASTSRKEGRRPERPGEQSVNSGSAVEPDAAPIYRDRKTGLKRDLKEEARQRAEESKKVDVTKEKYTRWGKGLAQVAATEGRVRDAMHEMSKPVARYADDADLDRMLRAQDREGDPMLEYIKSKSTNVAVASKPKYAGSWLPNRYNIPPGHRWDGVDRSSGYERQWFENVSARRAVEEDAYKWSVADM